MPELGVAYTEQVHARNTERRAINYLSLQSTVAILLYFGACLLVQAASGAWTAPFSAYPDEASHFVASVMVRDYVASGLHVSPLAYARNYYAHYPYFAVGYWPPVGYIVTALSFFLFGVGRVPALMVEAAAGAGTAWLLFLLMRRRVGPMLAFTPGLLYLSLPDVQRWTSAVMMDALVTFFVFVAAWFAIRYLERETTGAAIGFALSASVATLTKYNGAFACLIIVAAVVLTRKFHLLRRLSFWIQPVIMLALITPWVVVALPFSSIGLFARETPIVTRIFAYPPRTFGLFPTPVAWFIAVGLVLLLVRPQVWDTFVCVLSILMLGLFSLLILSPVEFELRYVLAAGAALTVLSFTGWIATLQHLARIRMIPEPAVVIVPAAAAICSAAFFALSYSRPPAYPLRAIAASVTSHPEWRHILAPADLEGPTIAEFVVRDHHRPSYTIERPGKLFATGDWFGRNYHSRFDSEDAMMQFLDTEPVDVVIRHNVPPDHPHETLLNGVLLHYPDRWRTVAVFPAGTPVGSFDVLAYVPPQRVGKAAQAGVP